MDFRVFTEQEIWKHIEQWPARLSLVDGPNCFQIIDETGGATCVSEYKTEEMGRVGINIGNSFWWGQNNWRERSLTQNDNI